MEKVEVELKQLKAVVSALAVGLTGWIGHNLENWWPHHGLIVRSMAKWHLQGWWLIEIQMQPWILFVNPLLSFLCSVFLANMSLLALLSVPEDVSFLLYLQVVIGELRKTIVKTPTVTGSLSNQAPSVANCIDIPEPLNCSIWEALPCT